jgi:quinone-modifying oxidoreductase subunit QmoB
MPEKIGVYIDESSLGPSLSGEDLAEKVRNKYGDLAAVVKTHPRLASEEGRELIKADIEADELDGVCVCSTSPRFDYDLFEFDNVLVERVNVREQAVKAYKNPDGTVPAQGAEAPDLLKSQVWDYIKMGVAKLSRTKVPEPEDIEAEQVIMVIGGGWTGLTAALNVAAAGHEVVLVEKEAELGGYAAKLYKTVPLSHPYTDAQETGVEAKIEAVKNSDKITVLTSATVEKLEGMPGQYTATVKTSGGTETLKVGSAVLATGWETQDPKYLEPFGYGKFKNVITTVELEEMAKKGEITSPAGGKPKSVAFVLSAEALMGEMLDERLAEKEAEIEEQIEEEPPPEGEDLDLDEKFKFEPIDSPFHVPYASEVTSLTALKQARYVREFDEDAIAYVFYEHMMVPGINERYYKAAQDDPGVMLTKGQVYAIREDKDGGIIIRARNTLFGEPVEVKVDLCVVPAGMVPTTANAPVVNFEYRQGPSLPDLELFEGFADSNYICFPYETRRTGVYAAGAVHQPMMMAMAEQDATGAALKAIQCVTSVNRGVSVHPRSGDRTFPVFNFVRCTQCKRCTEECPFGALDDDEKGTPKPNTGRCRRCGTCMGACPERVISFDNYSVDMVGSMIKEVEVPAMDEGGPRAIILACENDAYPALDMAAARHSQWSPYVRVIPVRCLGSVNTIWIADAMGKGLDGVLLLGCTYGEDYQCHFAKGSELCNRRMENVAETLNRLGVEPERVVQKQVAIDEYQEIPGIIDDFMKYILEIGANPFKGF